ncbi:MAG: class II fructose-bisphosphate aldolase [Planctomycetes bacterium]|nr:class II fructose-bisphosphate aldolase [Planctomycetota bacterium]
MPLVPTRDILADARKNAYAVPMFDVSNYEMIRSVIEAAEERQSPVMLGALKPDIEGVGLDYFIAMAQTAAKTSSIPIAIHLDHACSLEECQRVIEAGFNSVMIDGSATPFAENASMTKEVCDYAHKRGIDVEAELGHVPDAISGQGEAAHQGYEHKEIKDCLTQPDQVLRYVEQTGVDSLAVAIGTAHGSYISTPELDISRLQEINSSSPIPLVLHGGSGTPDEQIKNAIANGIAKINVFTDILIAMNSKKKEVLNELENMGTWPHVLNNKPNEALKEVVREKISLFGSNNRV